MLSFYHGLAFAAKMPQKSISPKTIPPTKSGLIDENYFTSPRKLSFIIHAASCKTWKLFGRWVKCLSVWLWLFEQLCNFKYAGARGLLRILFFVKWLSGARVGVHFSAKKVRRSDTELRWTCQLFLPCPSGRNVSLDKDSFQWVCKKKKNVL